MNSFYKIIFCVSLAMLFVVASNVQAANFYRNLTIGDSGQDVLELQKYLNKDPETLVAISGPGSIGNETTYFGNLTKNAVIKFQNKYRDQILTPVGLSVGTGYFGPSTISFINSGVLDVSNQNAVETNFEAETEKETESVVIEEVQKEEVEQNKTVESDLIRDNSLELYFVSQPVFEVGDELTIVGGNVGNDPEIYFFNFEEDAIVSNIDIDANFITFKAPNISEGKYEMYIKKENTISNPIVVEIVDNYNPPTISSISPSVISYGDTVTIKGSNFESKNVVMTALGTYSASSDGSTIELYMERPANLNVNQIISAPVEEKLEGLIQIQNSNGISDAEFVDFLYN